MKRLLIFVLCFCAHRLFAQTQPTFFRISDVIGLSGKYITATAQDNRGFIWIACNTGLYRYDGHQLLHANKDLKSNFNFMGIGEMITDRNGNLWIMDVESIGLLNTTTFVYKRIPTTPGQQTLKRRQGRLIHLCKDLEGRVYLAEALYGAAVYDSAEQKFVQKLPFPLPKGWPVSSIAQDPLSRNYLIASDSGLAICNAQTQTVYTQRNNPANLPVLNYPLNFAASFFVDAKRRYWVKYWSFDKKTFGINILCVDEKKGKATADTAGFMRQPDIDGSYEDSRGAVWMFGEALYREGPEEPHRFQHIVSDPSQPYTIAYTHVFHINEDREKNLWLSTDKGLYIYYPKAPTTYNFVSPYLNVTALYEEKPNEIWVGNWGGGISIIDSTLQSFQRNIFLKQAPADPNFHMVWCFQKHSATGLLWAGCQLGRIQVIDTKAKRLLHALNPTPFNNATIRQIKQDANGNLWFATQRGGLFEWQSGSSYADSSFRSVLNFNGIIHALHIDKKNNLWVGTEDDGVYVVNGYTHKIIRHFTSFGQEGSKLSINFIKAIEQLNDSLYAVLTQGVNLVNLNNGRIKILDASCGVPDNDYAAMAVDQGQVWLASFASIGSYHPGRELFSSSSLKEGLALTQTPKTLLLSSTGKIYAAGSLEMNAFYPTELQKPYAPPVAITAFRFFDNYLEIDSLLRLASVQFAYDQSSFTLSFSALSYALNDKLTYYYKLQGAEKEWIRVNGAPTVSYNLLPPGDYTFMVQGVNEKGVFSATTSMPIRVRQPFWFSWWFISLVAVAVGTVIYMLHRLNIKRILAVENLRQRVARDLHDDMGSTLSTINILSAMAKSKLVEDPVKSSEYMTKISDNSSRMMEAMDDIVWSINPYNDSMTKVLTRMRAFATEVLEAKGADLLFHADAEAENINLNMEQRRDLFLVFKEIINNAAKYSRATEVSVNINLRKNYLHLTVKDNGIGFVVAEADNGNGLNNMQRRALHLEGEISIQSQPGSGTSIHLRVPF